MSPGAVSVIVTVCEEEYTTPDAGEITGVVAVPNGVIFSVKETN
jgi:hypothetical protein